jgi:hypothetical protein
LLKVSRELARYKLDLVGVQEVRWEGGVILQRRIIWPEIQTGAS